MNNSTNFKNMLKDCYLFFVEKCSALGGVSHHSPHSININDIGTDISVPIEMIITKNAFSLS